MRQTKNSKIPNRLIFNRFGIYFLKIVYSNSISTTFHMPKNKRFSGNIRQYSNL